MDKSDRDGALESALKAGRLLEDQYFSRASKAIKEKNEEAFIAVCSDADLPKEIARRIYVALTLPPENRVW